MPSFQLQRFAAEESTPKTIDVDDRYPAEFSYEPPTVSVQSIVQLKGYPYEGRARWRVGFIQYIEKYDARSVYKTKQLVPEVTAPISDANLGNDPHLTQFQDPQAWENPCGPPWTDPPAKFYGNPGKANALENYGAAALGAYRRGSSSHSVFVFPMTGDAPNGRFNWAHPGPESPLELVERKLDFVTCLVIWDTDTSKIDHVLARMTWKHHVRFECDPNAVPRINVTYNGADIDESTIKLNTDVSQGLAVTIPDKALRTPTANEAARNNRVIERAGTAPDTGFISLAGSGITASVKAKFAKMEADSKKGMLPL